jgi:predicted metal-binding membrane protein
LDQPVGALGAVLRRERWVTLAGIAALAAVAWVVLARMAAGVGGSAMDGMSTSGAVMSRPSPAPWAVPELAALVVMWAIMMVAMMVPAAAPMVLLFAGTMRRRAARAEPAVATPVFLSGYLLVWAAFSVAAGSAQWALHRAALVSPATMRATPLLAAAILVAAGLFQWTPLKHACLSHCRSPLHFWLTGWREGAAGALAMGLRHGAWCVGCCWLLMALLFVAGVMNLVWVAALGLFVLAERVLPRGDVAARIAGIVLVAWGVWLAASAR